jgi:hypothetical protein
MTPWEIIPPEPHAEEDFAFPPPHWVGEPRPHGARRVRLWSRFPSLGYLTYLVSELGYDGSAAFASTVQAHQAWMRIVDRRRANSIDVDDVVTKFGRGNESSELIPKFNWSKSSKLVSPHPYIPAAPGRRTKLGGGQSKEQVRQALAKKRWNNEMKEAVFEIVYRRRSTLAVSNELGIPVETLYVYASRLRRDIKEADLHASEKVA